MSRRRGRAPGRGQSNLVALVAGLVALTSATALGLTLAGTAFDGAERPVDDRRIATALSERLVAPDSPLTARANVLDRDVLSRFDAADLDAAFPVVGERAVRIRVDGRTILERGDPVDGETIRRVVRVQDREAVTVEPPLSPATDYATTLPRRTPRVELTIDPPDGTTVRAVRVDGRVVLRNPSGLEGTFQVPVSRFETATLTFEVEGTLDSGDVEITYFPADTSKAVLEVTVGDR